MQFTSPKVHLLAQTKMDFPGLQSMLEALGAPDWETDARSDGDMLAEVCGRLCYKSFGLDLNPNLTKIREGNRGYVDNILKSKHFTVIEHPSATFAVTDISRVCTHETVRHRVAVYSQESLRFVRLTDLRTMFPKAFLNHPEVDRITQTFIKTIKALEDTQIELAEILQLDDPSVSFDAKKKLTSSMRRLAPLGLATNIIFTANTHSLRRMILQRTSRHAEEEIRGVFNQVFEYSLEMWPSMMQDAQTLMIDGQPEIHFEHGV